LRCGRCVFWWRGTKYLGRSQERRRRVLIPFAGLAQLSNQSTDSLGLIAEGGYQVRRGGLTSRIPERRTEQRDVPTEGIGDSGQRVTAGPGLPAPPSVDVAALHRGLAGER
jgi:hypothetical protein